MAFVRVKLENGREASVPAKFAKSRDLEPIESEAAVRGGRARPASSPTEAASAAAESTGEPTGEPSDESTKKSSASAAADPTEEKK